MYLIVPNGDTLKAFTVTSLTKDHFKFRDDFGYRIFELHILFDKQIKITELCTNVTDNYTLE